MKFDIKEYKNNPERRLILRNKTNQGPKYWSIDEIQAASGDIVIIKVPDANLDFPAYTMLDEDYNLKHDIHGIVGTLEFANEKLTVSGFIDRLITLPLDCSIDFSCDDEGGVNFGAVKLKHFDSLILLVSEYGGGNLFSYDLSDKIDRERLREELEDFLSDYSSGFIYADACDFPAELWGVTFEFEDIDGEKFRRLALSGSPFFETRKAAEVWISENRSLSFDEDFDINYCSCPRPVLIDRWTVRNSIY